MSSNTILFFIFYDTQICVCEQGEYPACDVVMIDDDKEDKQSTTIQVSHQEVWAPFENMWSNVLQTR